MRIRPSSEQQDKKKNLIHSEQLQGQPRKMMTNLAKGKSVLTYES